jgi:hypothetical protein
MQAGTQHHLYRFQVPVTAPAVVAEKHAQEPLYFSGDLLLDRRFHFFLRSRFFFLRGYG